MANKDFFPERPQSHPMIYAYKDSKELTGKYHAGNIVREMAKATGGGRRPDFAQAGGKDVGKLNDALEIVKKMI